VKKIEPQIIPILNVGDRVEYLDGMDKQPAVRGVIVGFYGDDRVKVLTQTGNEWLLKRPELKLLKRKFGVITVS
jgi:hypothetical protein